MIARDVAKQKRLYKALCPLFNAKKSRVNKLANTTTPANITTIELSFQLVAIGQTY